MIYFTNFTILNNKINKFLQEKIFQTLSISDLLHTYYSQKKLTEIEPSTQ